MLVCLSAIRVDDGRLIDGSFDLALLDLSTLAVDEGIVIGAVAEALGLHTGASACIFLTRHVLVCF